MSKRDHTDDFFVFEPVTSADSPKIRRELIHNIEGTILMFLQKLNTFTGDGTIGKGGKRRRSSVLVRNIVIKSRVKGSKTSFVLSHRGICRFTRQFVALCQVYSLLIRDRKASKRDLYYEFKKVYMDSQVYLDNAISKICRFYHKPRHCFNVTSTSRGFAQGSLILTSEAGAEINFKPYPVAIGSELTHFNNVNMMADVILVVEKDTVFKRLVDDGIFDVIPNVLLVTGRGFPDICTRTFLRWLMDQNPVYLFGLVDCDPYGLSIYSTYKYGAVRSEIEANGCKLTEILLIGLFMDEVVQMNLADVHKLRITAHDKRRLQKIQNIAKIKKDDMLYEQARQMIEAGFKVELEALASKEPDFLLQKLILPKLRPYI
ncbi:unnamed protein product [Bursaphelenchus okinawaensis]|uniref:DNA topoisomerase (ATP-hydrolyzing) n=1 Tax=Bursaphelenchus okinawaensis TaxID=465554 RepID=A0A811LA62_9BILA|nr:unnamed protein product [Bursaphelenchus okinawaensis]CAG9121916.1 unnamed protein product [Bursaphelenchus okinawaensis]